MNKISVTVQVQPYEARSIGSFAAVLNGENLDEFEVSWVLEDLIGLLDAITDSYYGYLFDPDCKEELDRFFNRVLALKSRLDNADNPESST